MVMRADAGVLAVEVQVTGSAGVGAPALQKGSRAAEAQVVGIAGSAGVGTPALQKGRGL
jgi:hypothetical protein